MRYIVLPDLDHIWTFHGANGEVYPDGQHDRAY